MHRHRPSTSLLVAATLIALAACQPATSPSAEVATPPKQAAAPSTAAPSTAAPSAMASAAASLASLASPREAVKTSIAKFVGVHSYHADMHMQGGPRGAMDNQIDFVAPDRYRMTLQGMGTQTIIGDTMYMIMRGHSMKVPMPAGTLSQWRDPAKLSENEATMTVEAQGRDNVDGVATRKYLVHHGQPHPSEVTLWIGTDDLPLQMQARNDLHGTLMTTTVRYSRFNDPALRIDAPK